MALQQIVRGVYTISLGVVNAYLVEGDDLTLVDTGTPSDTTKIVAAVRGLGRQPTDIRHILVTHCHPDHAGSLAALKQITGALAYMHPLDAAVVRRDEPARPLRAAPGLVNRIVFRTFIPRSPWTIPRAYVEHEILDGDVLPIAEGIRVIHTPGHCRGQLAFLLPRGGGVLFVGDAAQNMMRLNLMLGYEDLEVGRRSLAKLARQKFAAACFGHGAPIPRDAAARFKEKWGKA